ncbi:DUF6578 domain-containing protein [Streptomyces sp. NPDC093269]|uniref:DUF6578 domain-containing protein n=2 Tax=unclassified Streptomyces TaxID=2593676 RepID=UPI00380987F2
MSADDSANNGGMTLTIWVDDWQIQCCGENFTPGAVVSWQLLEIDPEDYADVVGSERAAAINFREEHHGQEEGKASTPLRVLTITEVHCRYEVPSDSTSNVQHAVAGTTVLVPVREADGWADARPGLSFAGYRVTAERPTSKQGGPVPHGR